MKNERTIKLMMPEFITSLDQELFHESTTLMKYEKTQRAKTKEKRKKERQTERRELFHLCVCRPLLAKKYKEA